MYHTVFTTVTAGHTLETCYFLHHFVPAGRKMNLTHTHEEPHLCVKSLPGLQPNFRLTT